MKLFRLFWKLHKWAGLGASVFLLLITVTGALLLWKKQIDWIQPPTQYDSIQSQGPFLSIEKVYEIAFQEGHPELQSPGDIARIDFRPKQKVFKVRSKHGNFELQIGAISGTILSAAARNSDWIESLHEGSFFGDISHRYIWNLVALTLGFLILSGVYIWVAPVLKRRRKRKLAQEKKL
jgi:uncharacterized iron-regulated membrane protein